MKPTPTRYQGSRQGSNLTINFADGGRGEFEVSPFIRSTVVRIVRALGY